MLVTRISSGFVAGVVVGALFVGAFWASFVWWRSPPKRAPTDAALYDNCLVVQHGNEVACDAFLRMINRARTQTAALKKRLQELLAAGFSKHEVVDWALKNGFAGGEVAEALGITQADLIAGKY